ncbi:MAG: cytochrome-c peroxidase [Crocinitomicaceae bacterium]
MKKVFYSLVVFILFFSCRKDQIQATAIIRPYEIDYPKVLNLVPPIKSPSDNPMTIEGIELGKELFYETLLSSDNTQSCASCHSVAHSFSDTVKFSVGITGTLGDRNAMPLFNLAWGTSFFWDGRSKTLEEQALEPITNPIEMNNTWQNAVEALQMSTKYPNLFMAAFGTKVIDSTLVVKALAQFERTLLSGNSPHDRHFNGETTGYSYDEVELMKNGRGIYLDEGKGGCADCHGYPFGAFFPDTNFRNNGLDFFPSDSGQAAVTGDAADLGKFKIPSIRNLVFTAPYMHDGRFETLEEVVEHYSREIRVSEYLDPLIHLDPDGDRLLTDQEEKALVFFLKSLSDDSFISNPNFQQP